MKIQIGQSYALAPLKAKPAAGVIRLANPTIVKVRAKTSAGSFLVETPSGNEIEVRKSRLLNY